jgi:nicotinate-nucleotide adenylyltransferase
MRLGIYGGSFDPVHYGHLLLAESAREQLQLQKVLFIPAAQAPHKQQQTAAPAAARVEMLELAIGGQRAFEVSPLEIERGGISYTVDTLEKVNKEEPAAEIFLLLGADSLVDLPGWKSPQEICRLATLAVVGRPGIEVDFTPLVAVADAERLEEFAACRVRMPQLEIKSRDLRARVGRGGSIRYQTPRSVEKYIEAAGLYRENL